MFCTVAQGGARKRELDEIPPEPEPEKESKPKAKKSKPAGQGGAPPAPEAPVPNGDGVAAGGLDLTAMLEQARAAIANGGAPPQAS